jgi:RHS repeat-associated protein
MSDRKKGQRPALSSSRAFKKFGFLLLASAACFMLAGPAQSQLASHQVKAPSFNVKADTATSAGIRNAPVQAELPAPPPIKYFPGFEEALVATGPVSDAENADLDAALKAFHDAPLNAGKGDDYSDYAKPLLAYIAAHPQSNWDSALYLNLGLGYYHAGYYSRAFDAFGKSWDAGKDATSFQAHMMADRAVGELAKMHSRVGHEPELKTLLTGLLGSKRSMGGPGDVLIRNARESLWVFHHNEGSAYLCGPKALRNMLVTLKAKKKQIRIADDARSGPHGFTLADVAKLADKTGFKYKLIRREPGQPVPVPSVINWNVHHYAAIIGKTSDGKYLVADPTFGDGGHELSQKTIDAEGSGYFLVPAKMATIKKSGWRIIDAKAKEAQDVYGMGSTTTGTLGNTAGFNCWSCALAEFGNELVTDFRNAIAGHMPAETLAANGHQMSAAVVQVGNVNLHIDDTPVGYKPQVGPSAKVSVFYNAMEGLQPATFSFSNLSPTWSHSWMAYIYDDPTSATGGLPQRQAAGGGGWQLPSGYPYVNRGSYCTYQWEEPGSSILARYPCTGTATQYILYLADGSQQVYNLFNSATTYPRTIFMTKYIDPQGNATTVNYYSQFRITSTTDAMGRNTTYSYGLTASPLLITQITDPFGRFSAMTYDSNHRLSTVTDPIGITSTYNYLSPSSTFISSLVTPYGTSTFNNTVNPNDPVESNQRSLVTTDPLGNSDMTYLFQQAPGINTSDPTATVPTGSCMSTVNNLLQWRNVFYWDKHAFTGNVTLNGSGVPISENLTPARIFHVVHNSQLGGGSYSYDTPESVKNPLENRVWYDYWAASFADMSGSNDRLSATGRVLDDGSSQIHCRTYNSGVIATDTDPLGRLTQYNWNANFVDLASIQQQVASGGVFTTFASFPSYNTQHEPLSYHDAQAQLWNYTYTALGQIKTVTDPLTNVTTYNYDTTNRLSTIVDANSITVLTLTYDADDRVQTRTDSQGYVLTYAYDNIDRVTKITYPDNTTDLYDYTFQSGPLAGTQSLELRKHTDRLGRVTTYAYDADQRLTSVTEPTSGTSTRTTQYKYYENGTLEDIIDANGNDTHWAIDIESRPVSKTYQFGTSSATTETYAYENTTSRLHSITDALGQVKTFTYGQDDRITGITYTASVNTTPNVTFAYDPWWPRLTSMTDGTGTTSYGYTAAGANGGLKLASVTSPYTNGTISLTYDADSRLNGRTIPGGNETFGYDAINRLNSHVTPLGSFTLGYLGETGQLNSQSVTNGSTTVSTGWTYDTNAHDRRLIGIANSGVTRSYIIGYGSGASINPYDILSVKDTAATGHPWATQSHAYTYDLIDRLLTGSSTTPGNSKFVYDNLDNATTFHQPPTASTTATYNGFNEIKKWGALTYAYDANGNLTSGDGVTTYKYDAENRLIEIDYVGTSNKSVFAYDGLGHRTSDAETVSGTTTTTYNMWCPSANGLTGSAIYGTTAYAVAKSTTNATPAGIFLPNGSEAVSGNLCQTRNAAQTVVRRDLPEGEYNASTSQKLVYMPDQLGSVRDVIDATAGNLVASYDFTPYGAVARSNVTDGTDFQYAALFQHPQSTLNLATYRAQDGATGRWINRDPITETGGIDLYGYVNASPTGHLDSSGLCTDPAYKERCASWQRSVANIQASINRREADILNNGVGKPPLPLDAPGDDKFPSLSVNGHIRLINEDKANLAGYNALIAKFCSDNNGSGGDAGPLTGGAPITVSPPTTSGTTTIGIILSTFGLGILAF